MTLKKEGWTFDSNIQPRGSIAERLLGAESEVNASHVSEVVLVTIV